MSGPGFWGSRSRPTLSITDVWAWAHTVHYWCLGLGPHCPLLMPGPGFWGSGPEPRGVGLGPHCPLLMSGPGFWGSRSRPTLSIIDVWAWAHTPGVLLTIPSVGLTGVYLCLMRPIVSTSAGQGPARHNCCQIFSKDLAVVREDGGGWP